MFLLREAILAGSFVGGSRPFVQGLGRKILVNLLDSQTPSRWNHLRGYREWCERNIYRTENDYKQRILLAYIFVKGFDPFS